MKISNSGHEYYVGTIADDGRILRMVGFDDRTQGKLAAANKTNTAVHLSNCQIRRSSYDNGLEVIVRKTTSVEPSPKKLKVEVPVQEEQRKVKINEIQNMEDGTVVSVQCKVVMVSPARVMSTGCIQHVSLADDTGTITLCCWDKNIDWVQVSTWYSLTNLGVGTFKDEKTLTLKSSSLVSEIMNVDDNAVQNAEEDGSIEVLNNASIIGTQYFNVHFVCIN